MDGIKMRTWVIWAAILFVIGLSADYFFWHLVLGQKTEMSDASPVESQISSEQRPSSTTAGFIETRGTDDSFIRDPAQPTPTPTEQGNNNFLVSLQACAPEIAAQTIATPEALMEYLRKSIGTAKEEVTVENYHLTMKDGSPRRVHIVLSDRTQGHRLKEVRYFKLDAEGYPERIETRAGATVESLLAEGNVNRHEVRSQLSFKDGSTVELEMHDNAVFEFQFNNHGKVLSCRYSECQCP